MADGRDDDWKPNGRPQSTIARNFSASLHDVFAIDNSLDGLTQSVEQKKKDLDSQTKELEALQARLKETETRLKEKVSRNSSPAGRNDGLSSPHQRLELGDTLKASESNSLQPPGSGSSHLASQMSYRAAPGYDQLTPSTRERWGPDPVSAEQEVPRRGSTGYRKPVDQSGSQ